MFLLSCLLLLLAHLVSCNNNNNDEQQGASLFTPSELIQVVGPSSFPKPTDIVVSENHVGMQAIPIVEPIAGHHRPEQDAIFAYAEGYSVEWYLSFFESLKSTGYAGDVVMAIAEEGIRSKGVLEYLSQQPNTVVYSVKMDCFDDDRITRIGRKKKGGENLDIFQMCLLNHVYGWKDDDGGKVLETALDPREGRVVATLRYEWYWIWAQHYHNNSWLMVLDARDSFFQVNPFADLPRQSNPDATTGKLWFFGENTEATRLGKSTKNKNWLRQGYGVEVLQALLEKPTICSGSSMGERVAMEQYLRALIQEKEETTVRMTGSDQGFHNYLYYSHKLSNVLAIESLTVWEQGKGIINNLGAMRTKPLSEWKIYNEDTYQVFNWDGTLSPVVHQWDRDKHLHNYRVRTLMPKLKKEWEQQEKAKKR